MPYQCICYLSFPVHLTHHHFLLNSTHEDRGMMAQYNLLGEEGTIWQGSREVDPSCILPTGARAKMVATSDEKVDDSAAGKNVYSSVYFVMMAMLISISPH